MSFEHPNLFPEEQAKLFIANDQQSRPLPSSSSSSSAAGISGSGISASATSPSPSVMANVADVTPLAAKMRPQTLQDIVGHEQVVDQLTALVAKQAVPSMIFWGPPGTGKTTLAYIVAHHTNAAVEELSAVSSGVKDVREKIETAKQRLTFTGRSTVLFIDEIHRFNKSQQDALLPAVEAGDITLIGATTENPAIEVNAALLSRLLLFTLESLTKTDLEILLDRATNRVEFTDVTLDNSAKEALLHAAQGDARMLLTLLDAVRVLNDTTITATHVNQVVATPHLRYDKTADNHYDQVSAFIKSMRGSDVSAAVYWMTRMLQSGEDPKFIARRMIILASEDIGLADPQALVMANAAWQTLQAVGMPEARYALTQVCVYLALAPKSNSITKTMAAVDVEVERLGNSPVPIHLRDGHYQGSERLGHGKGYQYPHDYPGHWVAQQYGPQGLQKLYSPGKEGGEQALTHWVQQRRSQK